MEQIIYGDVLFIVNFSMDFLALYITARLLHSSPHIAALVLASGIGGVYGVAAVFVSGHSLLNYTINISVALLMCFIVFGFTSIISLVRNTLVFYGIGFLMGGVMTALFNLANRGISGRGIVINGDMNTLHSDISPRGFVFAALTAVIFSYLSSMIMKKVKNKRTAEVLIRLGDKNVRIRGLVDSGNLLEEPVAALPCLICSYRSIKELLPPGTLPIFRDRNVGILEFADREFAKKVRIIPMRGIGSKGILCGIIPDEVKIDGETKKVCIACDPDDNNYASTDSIIPMSIM